MSPAAPPPTSGLEERLAGPVGRVERVAFAALWSGLLMGLYVGVAHWTHQSGAAPASLATPLAGWVPLLPWTCMIYGLLYAQVFVPLTLLVDRRVLLRGALAYAALVLVGLPFWVLWPVSVPREPVPVVDTLTWGLALIRALDPPTNCFPSMHVAEAFLAALVVRRLDPGLGRLMLGVAAAIWATTLTLGQHWFVDGLAGLAMALGADHLFFGRRPLPPEALVSAGRARALWAMVLYALAFVLLAAPWWLGWDEAIRWVTAQGGART